MKKTAYKKLGLENDGEDSSSQFSIDDQEEEDGSAFQSKPLSLDSLTIEAPRENNSSLRGVGSALASFKNAIQKSPQQPKNQKQEFVSPIASERDVSQPQVQRGSSREERANLLSRVFFWWVQALVILGAKHPLMETDLHEFPTLLQTKNVDKHFQWVWKQEQKREQTGESIKQRLLYRVFWRFGKIRLFHTFLLKFCGSCLQAAGPIVLRQLLQAIMVGTDLGWGIMWASLLFAAAVGQAYCFQHQYWLGFKYGLNYRNAVMTSVYRKLLKLSAAARQQMSTGQMLNLVAVDSVNVMDIVWNPHDWWAGPLLVLVNSIVLFYMVSYAALVGILLLFVILPLNYIVAKYTVRYQEALLKTSDQRISLISELLQGIKFIKYYNWEKVFQQDIHKVREGELVLLNKIQQLRATTRFIWNLIPAIVSFVVFAIYQLMGGVLNPPLAFTVLAIVNTMQEPISKFSDCLNQLIITRNSVRRLSEFMSLEEIDRSNHEQVPDDSPKEVEEDEQNKYAVRIRGEFTWDSELHTPTLQNIDLDISPSKLYIIVGSVGSGKSSLISTILGEMKRLKGFVNVLGHRSVVYSSQQAWLINGTLRDNILFGKSYDKKKYEEVVNCCALWKDIASFPGGDMTEIGEKATNLSGGQKHRVALARALYQQGDIYLMDEPLGALDATVALQIFESAIMNLLRNKTRLLITHHVQFLPYADHVVVMRDGQIEARGTYESLLEQGLDFSEIVKVGQGKIKDKISQSSLTSEPSKDAEGETFLEMPLEDRGIEAGRLSLDGNRLRSSQGNSAPPSPLVAVREFSKSFAISPVEGKQRIELLTEQLRKSLERASGEFKFRSISQPQSKEPQPKGKEPVEESVNLLSSGSAQQGLEKQDADQQAGSKDDKDMGSLIAREERPIGSVDRSIYMNYFKAGGLWLFILVASLFLISQSSRMGTDYWLGLWAQNSGKEGKGDHSWVFWLVGYILGCILSSGLVWVRELTLVFKSLRQAKELHQNMFDCILRAPISFFDTTPSGRIINRFSKDTSIVDNNLYNILSDVMGCGVIVLSIILMIVLVAPILLLPLIGIGVMYIWVQRFYRKSARELKRMEAISVSPIYSHFSESVAGVPIIRAYKREKQFLDQFRNIIDHNNKVFYWHFAVNRWLGVRLELVGGLIVLLTAVFCVSVATPPASAQDEQGKHGSSTTSRLFFQLSATLAGLCLSYVLRITSNLNWAVRQYTEMEISMNAVSRVLQYTQIPPEAPLERGIPEKDDEELTERDAGSPAIVLEPLRTVDWPSAGEIEIENLYVRHREGLDFVLKNISCRIKPQEKIGIVGRTGAGKSTLCSVFFRLIEPASGSVRIDGVDIQSIGLNQVRSSLCIIPQDPLLFRGTIRENLDPYNLYSDDLIWKSLENTNLRSVVYNMPLKLDTPIVENGENLSLGQRQLFCLARALLKGPKLKILLMDEATANLDFETEELIHKTLKEHFQHATTLTIAHKIQSIIDSDKVMVLDKGELKEFDTPGALLSKGDSLFTQLVESALKVGEKE